MAAQNLAAESGIPARTVAQWLRRIDNRDGLAGIDVLVAIQQQCGQEQAALDRQLDPSVQMDLDYHQRSLHADIHHDVHRDIDRGGPGLGL